MLLLNVWLYILSFFSVCMVITVIIIATAPEYIEDEFGNLLSKKEFEKIKNQLKKKKQQDNPPL
jgi:hypothetical protein